jgi:hypothetical protein
MESVLESLVSDKLTEIYSTKLGNYQNIKSFSLLRKLIEEKKIIFQAILKNVSNLIKTHFKAIWEKKVYSLMVDEGLWEELSTGLNYAIKGIIKKVCGEQLTYVILSLLKNFDFMELLYFRTL